MNKWMAIFILTFLSGMASALELPAVPAPVDNALTVGHDTTPVPCDKIVDRLVEYNAQARQHDQSLTAFLGQISDKLTGWYDLLSPLENTPQTIAPNTFSPLKDGAEKVAQITNMAFDNSDLLAQELDTLISSLRACQNK